MRSTVKMNANAPLTLLCPYWLWLDIRGVIITVLRRRAYFGYLGIFVLSIWHSHKEAKIQTGSGKMRFGFLGSNPHKAQRGVAYPTHRTIVIVLKGMNTSKPLKHTSPSYSPHLPLSFPFFVWRWALAVSPLNFSYSHVPLCFLVVYSTSIQSAS